MSSVQSATIAHCHDATQFNEDCIDMIDLPVDANGDPVKNGSVMTITSSSEEDIASCSSNNDEDDDVIQLKTR